MCPSGPSSRHQDNGHCAAVVLRGHLRKTKESKRGEMSLHAVTQVWHTYERQEELQTEASSPKKASAKSWRVPSPKEFTWMGHHSYFDCVQSLGIAQEKSDLNVMPGAEGLGKQEGLSQQVFLEQIWKGTFLWSLATYSRDDPVSKDDRLRALETRTESTERKGYWIWSYWKGKA